jgi:hypothetical protein
VLHPTFEDARANWDKVSEWDRKNIEAAEAFRAEVARRKLREPAQLPDIPEPNFTLAWDFVDEGSHRETLTKCGDKIIFAEPALWEGYERFVEVAGILRARYGAALCDLMPTAVGELYLYGDCSDSSRVVAAARKRIFDGSGKEEA